MAHPNRARLDGSLTLTVPVEGGSRALKRPDADPVISQHGRWQHVHLGALEARLGTTPFWRHLEPSVVPLIAGAEGRLFDLNRALAEALADFLDLRSLVPELREFARLNPARLRELSDRWLRVTDPDAPLLTAAARYGRDAIFILAPPFIGV